MTKFRFSSKMHLFIIISAIIVAIGLAVGLVCRFTANGFFNPGADYASYRAVRVEYTMPFTEEQVSEICESAFDENGVSYYASVSASNAGGSEVEYRFASSVDEAALKAAAESINSQVGLNSDLLGSAYYSEFTAEFGGANDMMYAGIALAAAVVFQFLYFVIRYKFTMAISAFIADLHNLALFYALVAITRVQVSLSVVAMSVFVVLLTMVCCGILFDKMRKNFRQDVYKAMSSFEQVDAASRESFKLVTLINVVLAVAFLVMLIFGLFAGSGIYGIFMPCAGGIIAAAVCEYGTMFFTPSVYSRLKKRADDYAAKKASRYSGAKKSVKPAE